MPSSADLSPIAKLVLLTGAFEAGLLMPMFRRVAPGTVCVHADSRDALAREIDRDPRFRLLAFCTATIVPRDWLDRLSGPAYNVHPGPPNYPGRHPESWGSYYAAPRFGATLHEMAPRVDEGAIVDVEWIDVEAGGVERAGSQSDYGIAGFKAGVTLLMRWAPILADPDKKLPKSDLRWSGRKTTHAQLEAMRRLTPDMSRDEIERRRRAFAQQPGSRMTLHFHGLDFVYITPEDAGPRDAGTV